MSRMFEELTGKKILILGFGIEGQSTYKLLRSIFPQRELAIADQKTLKGSELFKKDKNFGLHLGKGYLDSLGKYDVVIKSPGVPHKLSQIKKAKQKGVEFTSQTRLFFDNYQGMVIGVTGTKGKSTTASLIYAILKKAGKNTVLLGNIGSPPLDALEKSGKDTVFVFEMSSHQLADLKKSPHIAVLLNIYKEHMDFYENFSDYLSAKKNIVRYQKRSDFAVINKDYETPKSFSKITKAKVIFFSGKSLEEKYKKNLLLRGEHNFENVSAAVSVAKILGIKDRMTLDILSTFKGLEHRLELSGEVGGVGYYNDSLATVPESCLAAVKSFDAPLTLILGGFDRGVEFAELGQELSKRKNLKTVLLIGQTKQKMKKALLNGGFEGELIDMGKKGMSEVVKKAYKSTSKGGVVLLSPAAASFDMFKDYKDRGDQFKKAAQSLK